MEKNKQIKIKSFKKQADRFLQICGEKISISEEDDQLIADGEPSSARKLVTLELLRYFVYISDASDAFTQEDSVLFLSIFDYDLNNFTALQLMNGMKRDGNIDESHLFQKPLSLTIAEELDKQLELPTEGIAGHAVDTVISLYDQLGQIITENKNDKACLERSRKYIQFLKNCASNNTYLKPTPDREKKESIISKSKESHFSDMDKYIEFKNEYASFLSSLPEKTDKVAVESFLTASILKIWGSNILYSPDYAELLSAVFEKPYTVEQIVTAMGCCGDKERQLLVPDFFKDLVSADRKDNTEKAAKALSMLDDLFTAAALINGDFTVEEAACQTEILEILVNYAQGAGVKIGNLPDLGPKITEKKIDSYLQNAELMNATMKKSNPGSHTVEGREDSPDDDMVDVNVGKDDKEDGEITLHVSLDLSGGSDPDENRTRSLSSSDENKEQAAPASKPDENETMESLLEELDTLVGLDNVKKDVHSLMNFIKVVKIREQRGMKVPKISYHLVFTGNPGTGKTTVARLVAKLYYHMGILSQGQLVETDRSMLVAGYLGQTAIKTQKVIQQALGGVLFIDEAYSLTNDDQDSYGKEAIETILKAMEDHRDELVVIVAGYTELMHKFIESNPGLSSRFSKYFEFPDYTAAELLAIFRRFCKSNGYDLDPNAESLLKEKFSVLYDNRDEHFGNARTARNIFEKTINVQADRLAQQQSISDADLAGITPEDIRMAIGGGQA